MSLLTYFITFSLVLTYSLTRLLRYPTYDPPLEESRSGGASTLFVGAPHGVSLPPRPYTGEASPKMRFRGVSRASRERPWRSPPRRMKRTPRARTIGSIESHLACVVLCFCVCVCVCYLKPLLPPTLEFQVLSFPILSPSIYSRFEAPAPGGMRVIDQGS